MARARARCARASAASSAACSARRDEPRATTALGARGRALLWATAGDAAAAHAALRAAGFRSDAASAWSSSCASCARRARCARCRRRTLQRMRRRWCALLLEEARARRRPEIGAAPRARRASQAIAGRAHLPHAAARERRPRARSWCGCARPVRGSPTSSRRSPVLLDALLDPRTLYAPPERAEMQAELAERFANVAAGDIEAGMDAAAPLPQGDDAARRGGRPRRRAAAGQGQRPPDLAGRGDAGSRRCDLSWARAERAVRRAAARRRPAGWRSRWSPTASSAASRWATARDLDMVFLHDCDALRRRDRAAARKRARQRGLAGAARAAHHPLAVDADPRRARLRGRPGTAARRPPRPDGAMRCRASREYQREQRLDLGAPGADARARRWPATRALAQAFDALRARGADAAARPDKLRKDVVEMRAKMRQHLDKARATGRFDLKQGAGGLTDIEFITQYLVLRDAHRAPGAGRLARQLAPDRGAGRGRRAEAPQQARVLIDGLPRATAPGCTPRDLQQARTNCR